jgi:hypothetical protein
MDIPPPPYAREVARALARSIRTDDPDGVLVAVVSEAPAVPDADDGDGAGEEGLPHRHLVHQLVLALDAAGVPVREALLVGRGRWWSYDCPDPCCAPGAGTALPAGTSALAAASVVSGAVLAGSRAELEARIAAPDGPERAQVAAACLDHAAARAARARAIGWPAVGDQAWAVVREAVTRRRSSGLAALVRLSPAELAEIVWGLCDTTVRDRALALSLGDDATAAEDLWAECTRRAPTPLDAAPATLLAVSAWLRGDGAMANVALDRALDSDPGYPLADLLARGLAACLSPAELRELIAATADGVGGA